MGLVHVTFVSTLAPMFEARVVPFEGTSITLREVLRGMSHAANGTFEELVFGKNEILNKYVLAMVNGTDARAISGLDTRLRDGDALALVPAIAGG